MCRIKDLPSLKGNGGADANPESPSGSAMDITDTYSPPVAQGVGEADPPIEPESYALDHSNPVTEGKVTTKRAKPTRRAVAHVVVARKAPSRSSAPPEAKSAKSRRSASAPKNLAAPPTLHGGIDNSPVKVPSDDSDDDELLLKPSR